MNGLTGTPPPPAICFLWRRLWIAVTILWLAGMSTGGCGREENDYLWSHEEEIERSIGFLKRGVADLNLTQERRYRRKIALSRLQNGIVDPRPFLIDAQLVLREPSEEAGLIIWTFDRDQDLRGLRITELHSAPDGTTTTLEEDYPIHAASVVGPIVESLLYPVELRTQGQRKDEAAWRDYMIWAFDEIICRFVDKRETESPDMPLPPIYVSVPKANEVRVFAKLYDRAGNESESLEIPVPYWSRQQRAEDGDGAATRRQ